MNKYAYKKITTAKNTFYYLEFGQTHQKTILCLHGYVDTAEIFKELGLHFESKYRIIALDFPMPRDGNIAYSLDMLAGYVLEFIKLVRLKNLDLFGFSLGGLVAIAVAAKCANVGRLYIANVVPNLLNNPRTRLFYHTVFPLITTRFFCRILARIKTNHLWADKIGAIRDSQTLVRMRKNYYSTFATMFNLIKSDLTSTFNNLKCRKYLFLFADDEVLNYAKYHKEIEKLASKIYIFEKGGHLSKPEYWDEIVPHIG